jgi:hypothetical protein
MPTKLITSLVLCTVVFLAVTQTGCAPEARETAPANRIAVLIDGSGTFKRRRAEAVERVAKLIDKIAQTQHRRFEGLQDTVAVIAIDAMPSVLWRGNLEELRSVDPSSWVRRFDSRSDYSACTDIDTAFRLATEELGASSRQVHKFAFVFSDLQHEPPASDIDRCEPARKGPGDAFPWDRLEDVAVSVLWVPRSQKLLWYRQIEKRGMAATFKLYTDSESAEVETVPPPVVKRIVTEQERKQTQAWLGAVLWGVVKLGALVVCIVVMLPILVLALRRFRRRKSDRLLVSAQRGRPSA